MIALTAILRVRPGAEETVKAALLKVAAYAAAEEAGTISYYCGQDGGDPSVFTTYERYRDRAAMDQHNGSSVVAEFFAVAKPLLAGEPVIQVSEEIFPA